MIPSKLLSWSIMLLIPLSTIVFLNGYFGVYSTSLESGAITKPAVSSSSFLNTFSFARTAQAQDLPIDVGVTQTIFPEGKLMPSQPIVYTLFVTNNSSISLSNIIVSDILPRQVVSATVITTPKGSTIQELSGYPDYVWQVDNLLPNTRADFYIVARMAADLNTSGTMENVFKAAVSGDSIQANNSNSLSSELRIPEASFEALELSFTEEEAVVNVRVNLTPSNPYGDASVDFGTSTGFSSSQLAESLDFEAVSGTIAFASPQKSGAIIEVSLRDDKIDEGDETFQLFLENAKGATIGNSGLVTITIEDDDQAGVTLSTQLLSLAEGSALTPYTLVLDTKPISPVVVEVQAYPQIFAELEQVTFTPENWDTAQSVNVKAVDDTIAEGAHTGTIRHSITSTDEKYNDLTVSSIAAGIVDNDEASFNLGTVALTVTEGVVGASTSYSMSLNAQPTQPVVVEITADLPIEVSPTKLTFTPDNWDQEQFIAVSTIDDSVITDFAGSVRHRVTESDLAFSKVVIPNVALIYVDNDSPGVKITSTTPFTVSEGVAGLSYQVSLNTEPDQVVVIELTTDSQVDVAPASLTFDRSNWHLSQPLTVTIIDDTTVEGTHTGKIEHNPQSTDPSYGQLPPTEVVLQIIDNDMLIYVPYIQADAAGE